MRMTRFSLPYLAPEPAPAPRRWTLWRLFLWVLLMVSMTFWVYWIAGGQVA